MPYASHDHAHQYYRAIITKYIYEDLQYRLPVGTRYRILKVLNTEKETEHDEQTEEGAEAH